MNSRNLTHAVRYLLGAGFFVFGLNGFLNFLPTPPPPPPAALSFVGALFATGYMIPLIKGTEVLAALLLLSDRYVPLALALLAPVLVNILAFHLILAPAGLIVPFAFLVAELYLAWSYREAFLPMLRARVLPSETLASRATPRAARASV